MDFAQLLKLAEKKQHEPIVIEAKPKVEEERPMTKRQWEEYTREKERKEQRERERNLEVTRKPSAASAPSKPQLIKTQLNKVSKASEKSQSPNSTSNKSAIPKVASTMPKKTVNNRPSDKQSAEKSDSSKGVSKNELLEERKKLDAERRQLEEMRRAIEEEKKKLAQSRSKQEEDTKSQARPSNNKVITKPKVADKQISFKDVKQRQFPSADLKLNSSSSLVGNKPRQFPPPDVRPAKPKPAAMKKPSLASNKREFNL